MLFGRPRNEVYEEVLAIFTEFDVDGNHSLDAAEFKECLMKTELMGRPLSDEEF